MIIAGAGGAAHLPGMVASHTLLPVLGVPVQSRGAQRARLAALDRADARRRAGRHAGDRQGRRDATPALLAVRCLALARPELRAKLRAFASEQERRAEDVPRARLRRCVEP